jgi:hypothetical protein
MSMTTATIKGFVYEADYGYSSEPEYRFFSSPDMGDKYYTLIGPCEFTYELPADFNSKSAKIAALQKEQERLRAEFFAKVGAITQRISELQAIEFVAA